MLGIMYAYIGTHRARCPDCGERITVPHDYAFPARQQPTEIDREVRRILLDHAAVMPLIHPRMMPMHHAIGTRR
jgi:hypothetical protein